ncbi:endonuclease/exonuclease/phosphatase family protein [Candidatus Saccharibacteria bacterium]|nr:endonuclease/exonuclease/phosphatase family protein [Candidatus Saccharibacteria bacterium]
MKLVQLNVWWGGKLDNSIKQLLETEVADILCLQEAASSTLKDAGPFLTIESMQKLGYSYKEFAPEFSLKFMRNDISFGNAILSNLPIKFSSAIYTNLEHVEDFDFSLHDYNIRNVLHCVYEISGKRLNVLTHHGHHVHEHKNGNEDTLRQMEQIVDYVKGLEGEVILTGDFNLAPNSKSLQLLNNVLDNLAIKYGLETTRNSLTTKDEVCDYIFVSSGVNVESFIASEELVSDHMALILDFSI